MGISRDITTRELAGLAAPQQPGTYTIEQAARLLGIGRNQAYEAAHRGDIPTIRIGKRFLVPRVALDRLLEVGNTRAP